MGEADSSVRHESSFRIRAGFETLAKVFLRRVTVTGRENLTLYPHTPIVLATTHTSAMDVPTAAAALAPMLDLGFAHISGQNLKNDPATAIEIALLGRENFFPIDYTGKAYRWQPEKFNPKNYVPMAEAMKRGKKIMIAAHNPSYDMVLPKGGYGAIWLAHEANAVVVPVAVDIHVDPDYPGTHGAGLNEKLLSNYPRTDADVHIGKPMILEPFPTNNDPREEKNAQFQQVRVESDRLMCALAAMLPREKQGMWAIQTNLSKAS